MNTDNQYQCPVCDAPGMQVFVSIPQAPVHCNLLWSDRDAALKAAKGDIELAYCAECGHIYNVAFDLAAMEYTQAYENSLHFSPRFQTFAQKLAQGLIDRYGLHGKEIVETGAGQGDFLRLLCELGDNHGWGFDAAYVPSEQDLQDERITFVQSFDWWDYIEQAPDMFYTRHVLEHIEKPQEFMQTIRDKIGDRKDTLVFFEMPNMAYTLRELAIWDILYEHCSYFTSSSLTRLFCRSGFQVKRTEEVYAGQFLTIEAFPAASRQNIDNAVFAELAEVSERVTAFSEEFRQKVSEWQTRLEQWAQAGKKVVAWGAGTKGVTFLNVLNTDEKIKYIIDINPRKEGKFVVGTGQQIMPPQFLRDYKPDVVVLMNPIYQEEIRQIMADMGLTAEFAIA